MQPIGPEHSGPARRPTYGILGLAACSVLLATLVAARCWPREEVKLLSVSVPQGASFRYLWQVEGKNGWETASRPLDEGAAHGLLELFEGATHRVPRGTLTLRADWPPLARIYPTWQPSPPRSWLEVYVDDSEKPCMSFEVRGAHAVAVDFVQYSIAEGRRAELERVLAAVEQPD